MMKGKRNPRSDASDIFSLGCVFVEIATLVIGRNLSSLAAYIKVHHRGYGLDYSYFCNLRVVYEWIQTIERDNQKGIRSYRRETTLILQTPMTDALRTIRRMLDSDPANRPSAHRLWEQFKRVSSKKCADCDPRHPDVWRPHDMIDSDLTPPMTFQKALEVEPAPLSNHNGIVHKDSSGASAGYSTRLVDEVSGNDKDNIIDRNSGSGPQKRRKSNGENRLMIGKKALQFKDSTILKSTTVRRPRFLLKLPKVRGQAPSLSAASIYCVRLQKRR